MRCALQAHAEVCTKLLSLAVLEEQLLRGAEAYVAGVNDGARKNLMVVLDRTLELLKAQRMAWQQLSAAERARHPDIARFIQSTQEIGMKLIVLDRENEQALLRRGLLPARHLPSAQRQQPNYVAGLYQRHRA
jgi:hypothetical protein